tara:strand:- start:2248 stop:3147 length:900 start_codon:yes stop_codon:yes gene_type:complete
MNYFLHFLRIIKSIIKKPIKSLLWFWQDLKKDFEASKIKSENKFVWCPGLPKSGTTLLEQILERLPYVRLESSFLRIFDNKNLDHGHGISTRMFSKIPKQKFTFLKTHTHYTNEYERIALNKKAKIIVSLRDLRDMLISRYYHILFDKNHWLHNKIKKLNFSSGFILSLKEKSSPELESALIYYYKWIKDWLVIAKQKDYLVLWYEDYKLDPIKYINRVILYTNNKNYSAIKIENEIKYARLKKKDLSNSIYSYGRSKSTFRKGLVGEWKLLFNNEINDYLNKNLPGPIDEVSYKQNIK